MAILLNPAEPKIRSGALLRAGLISIGTGVAVQLCLLVSGSLVARMLGASGRGYLAGLSLWAVLLTCIGSLGIPSACTFFLSQRPDQTRSIVREAMYLGVVQSLVISLALWVVLAVWSADKPREVSALIWLVLVMVPVTLVQQYGAATLQGQQRFSILALTRLGPSALYAAAVVVIFLTGSHNLPSVVACWVGSFGSAAIATAAAALVGTGGLRGPARIPGTTVRLLRFGLRGHVGSLSPIDSLRLDQVTVAILFSPEALGIYVVGYAFTNLPKLIADSAASIAYPAIAHEPDRTKRRRMVSEAFWAVTVLNAVAAGLVIGLMPVLIRWLFGEAFLAAVPIGRVLLAGTTLVACRRILVEGMRGLGAPHVSTAAEVSMYPCLAIIAPPLTAWYGPMGLAGALTLGYAISFVIALVAARRVLTGFASVPVHVAHSPVGRTVL